MMSMALPKGTFKGLARVLTPLSFWMAAGWAAYPPMILKIVDDAGESMDAEQVWLFSKIMVTACMVAGMALAAYGFTGKDASDHDIKELGRAPVLCPYCGKNLLDNAAQCPECRNILPK